MYYFNVNLLNWIKNNFQNFIENIHVENCCLHAGFFLSRVVNLHKSNYEIGFKVSSSPGIYPRCNTFHSELYLNKSDFWHWSNYMFQSPHKYHRHTNPSNTITKHISPFGDHQPRLQCVHRIINRCM